jgi:hypothetical protein
MSNKVFAGEARLRLNGFGAARDVVSGMSIKVFVLREGFRAFPRLFFSSEQNKQKPTS